jgi:hypothetical protein
MHQQRRALPRVIAGLLLLLAQGAVADAVPLPAPSCPEATGGGVALSAAPSLVATLYDSWHEAWLASPAVADLDADGENEIVVARERKVLGWHLDGEIVFSVEKRCRTHLVFARRGRSAPRQPGPRSGRGE